MAAAANTHTPDSGWQREPACNGKQPDNALLAWLLDSGLLTRRLRQLGHGDFRLQVLPPDDPANAPVAAGLRRVLLWSGEHACIYAQTKIPAATLRAHPWLAALGNEPLGETLHSRADVRRTPFEFALVNREGLPGQVPAADDATLWARRSDFLLDEHGLTVTEIFLGGLAVLLPAVKDIPRQTMHD